MFNSYEIGLLTDKALTNVEHWAKETRDKQLLEKVKQEQRKRHLESL
jgi:hypothetical protein